MRLHFLFAVAALTAACSSLASLPSFLHGGGGGNATSQQTTTTTTTTSETQHASLNGEPVALGEPEARPRSHASGPKKGAGATCHRNSECESERGGCYKGYGGEVGYCTTGCEDSFQCPDFWECSRPAGLNTPSKICLQPKD